MNGLRRGGIFAQVLALSLLGVQVPDRHAEAVSRAEEALLGALNYLPEGWDRSEAFRLLRADAGARAAAGPAFADAVADVVELMQRWSNAGWRAVRVAAEQGDGWVCCWFFAGPGCYQILLSRPGDDVLPEATYRTAPEAREAVLAGASSLGTRARPDSTAGDTAARTATHSANACGYRPPVSPSRVRRAARLHYLGALRAGGCGVTSRIIPEPIMAYVRAPEKPIRL